MICDNVRLCRNECIDAEVSLCTSPVFVMPYQHLLLKPFTLSNSMCPCAWALMGISKVVWDYEQPKLHWQLQFHQLFPWLSCFVKKDKKTSFFSQKWRHTSKMRCRTPKSFFQNIHHVKGNKLFSDSLAWKRLWKGANYLFCQKLTKRRLFGLKMTSYVKGETSRDKLFFQNIQHIKGNNFFSNSLAWKRH